MRNKRPTYGFGGAPALVPCDFFDGALYLDDVEGAAL